MITVLDEICQLAAVITWRRVQCEINFV